jgi:hypothetical protein
MEFLTKDAIILCDHGPGIVQVHHTQTLVTISGRQVLVENDPEGRRITGCPNLGATIKPCTTTLKVNAGYSAFIRIQGRRVCLSTVTGLTDGTPPVAVKYAVRQPGQHFVGEA